MQRRRLLCSTALFAAALSTSALAQDQDAPAAVQVITSEDTVQDDVTTVEALVVQTGTRLRLPDYVAANPTITIGDEQIISSGETNITEFLLDLPALTGSTDDALAADTTTPGQVGLNLLDLRNLGETRTLVLVNGRRHVASFPGTSAVDVNTIPTDLIERVEVLTGGASAVYGADGVSGVVNFILKDDFEGIVTRTQYGQPEDGGAATSFVSILGGQNLLGGNLNITGSVEYYSRDDLKFDDREYTRTGVRRTLVNNPEELADPTTNDEDIYDLILSNNLRYYDTSLEGSIITRPDYAFRWLGSGEPFVEGTATGDFIVIGGSGTLLDLYNDDLLPGHDRLTVNSTVRYDITPRLRLFGEVKISQSDSDFVAQPTYDYGLLFTDDENPFVPDIVNQEAFGAGGLGAYIVARDNFDLGRTTYDIERETHRAVLGVNGFINDWLAFEVSAVYGRAREDLFTSNVRINERFFAAIDVIEDANGDPVCRTNLDPAAIPAGDIFAQFPLDPATFGTTFTPGPGSGCVPANIFGVGNLSQEAIDWINTDVTERSEIEQGVLTAYLTGDTGAFFSIPNGGPLSFVLGGEYRDESSDYRPDPIQILSDDLGYPLTSAGRASVTTGSFHVAELFGELSIPLLVDKPFAELVQVQGAYRYSDYSTAGYAHTWNTSGRWQVNDTFMIRGTLARAVRAPNVNNLFRGRSQTFESLVDPCSSSNFNDLGENPQIRAANCAADLAALGLTFGPDPATNFTDTSSEAIGGFLLGNPDLAPEVAFTQTAGIVYTPTYVPGLAVSVDYYSIVIDDAIQSYEPQTILDNCYDLPRPNPFCDLIERSGGGVNPGRISGFTQVPGNIAAYETQGVDFTVRYDLDPARFGVQRDIGQFSFNLLGNFLDRLAFVESETAAPDLDDGDIGAPTFQATLDVSWFRGPWQVDYGFSYFNETRRLSRVSRETNPDTYAPQYWNYAAKEEHDLRVAYTYDDRYEFYAGVNNLTNQKPEFQDFLYPVSPLGRFFYVGLRAELN